MNFDNILILAVFLLGLSVLIRVLMVRFPTVKGMHWLYPLGALAYLGLVLPDIFGRIAMFWLSLESSYCHVHPRERSLPGGKGARCPGKESLF